MQVEYEGKSKKIVNGRRVKAGDVVEVPEGFKHAEFKIIKGADNKKNKNGGEK